ncbi:MAG: efflux RND transporter periplasmic adaptor subunit [Phycisphaerae bacterium]
MRRRWFVVGLVVLLGVFTLGVRSTAIGWFDRLMGRVDASGAFHEAEPVTLSITLTEDGELKPRESINIKCEVEGQSTILYVVEESTRVQKGDLLVELASDTLEDRLRSKQMELRRIQADYEAAVAELAIQKNQNASNIKKAQIDLEVAELDLQKYLEGDFKGQLKEIDLQIQKSEMDIDRRERELEENRELEARGWVRSDEIEQWEFALEVAKMQLERHLLSKEILLKYEKPKVEKQRRSTVDRAREELGREKKRALSREKKSQARVDQYKDQLDNSKNDCERIAAQVEKCKMYAPAEGVVQYPSYGGWRWGSERIAAGERVHEGQTLVVLPDTSQMLVTTRIHEADRHLVKEGLPCVVTIPAVPGETFTGKIAKIDRYADSENRWLNPDLKEHGAEILLDETDAPLSPGDSAEVKILIDTIENVLAVPVQCVFSRGARSFVFVQDGGAREPVEVTLGRSNTRMIEIVDGLKSGDRVLMHADEPLLAKLPPVEAADAAAERAALAKPLPTGKPGAAEHSKKKPVIKKTMTPRRAAAGRRASAGGSGD